MKNQLSKIFSDKTLIKNFTSLSLLQFTNYLFPLITFPYLVRVLGSDRYGLINFVAAFTGYFTILTDYGFNLSATQEISINRNNKKRISELFSNVISAKFVLYIISSLIFAICLILFDVFKDDLFIYVISYSGLLGTVLFPLWFFQGMEKMNFIFIINFIIKLITVVTILLFIRLSTDYLLLVGIYSIGQLVYGFSGLFFVRKYFGIKFLLPNFKNILNEIITSKNYFISSLGINVITNSNVFILGLFAEKSIVGYFAAADKIRLAMQSMLNPIFTSTFPHVSNLAKNSLSSFYIFSKKLFSLTFSMGLTIFLILFFGAEGISEIVLGNGFQNSILILKILSVVPLLYGISNFLGVQILLPLELSKKYAFIMISTVIIHIVSSLVLVYNFQAIGSTAAIIFSEMFLIFVLVFTFVRFRLNIKSE